MGVHCTGILPTVRVTHAVWKAIGFAQRVRENDTETREASVRWMWWHTIYPSLFIYIKIVFFSSFRRKRPFALFCNILFDCFTPTETPTAHHEKVSRTRSIKQTNNSSNNKNVAFAIPAVHSSSAISLFLTLVSKGVVQLLDYNMSPLPLFQPHYEEKTTCGSSYKCASGCEYFVAINSVWLLLFIYFCYCFC
eukprot:gene9033-6334_t